MLKQKLENLHLPPLKTREEMLDVLHSEEYGYPPEKPESISVVSDEMLIERFCAGHAPLRKVTLSCKLSCGEFTFPVTYAVPAWGEKKKYPAFVHINFRPDMPDRYQPTEEIIDRGYAVFTIYYNDIVPDEDDGHKKGLAALLFKDGERKPTDPGKISMWAWGAQRVMDYLETRNDIDLDRVAVLGHSRLGKTALLTAAEDTRFYCACSNDAGTSGDAITRCKVGETVDDICARFGFWFCENYNKYRNNEQNMPFDQHWLIACIAPRFCALGSAEEDWWADPEFQHLSALAASPAFEKGLITPDRKPQTGDVFNEGDIAFHLRRGSHFLNRQDWLRYLDFLDSKA